MMKFTLLLTVATAVSAEMMTHPGAKEICGRLGPMWFDPDELHEGTSPDRVRMCAEHPMSMANWWGLGEYLPHWFPRPPFVEETDFSQIGRFAPLASDESRCFRQCMGDSQTGMDG